MMPRDTTERTPFAPTTADTVVPRLEPDRFSMPARLATAIPYFDPPALRELAVRARRFAETLSPPYRRIMLEKAQRLEREAAQQEAADQH